MYPSFNYKNQYIRFKLNKSINYQTRLPRYQISSRYSDIEMETGQKSPLKPRDTYPRFIKHARATSPPHIIFPLV